MQDERGMGKMLLTDYIRAAMRQAQYELMENRRFFGRIRSCRGVWAEGETLESCREELQSTLEDWLLLGLQLGHKLPVIDGINLNRKAVRREPAYAKAH
jgi:predicted RNase H-like HicB family nuclease